MAETISIAVTGERDFAAAHVVCRELDAAAALAEHVVLFVGDCEAGADKHARDWFHRRYPNATPTEPKHPLTRIWRDGYDVLAVFVADWDRLDRAAGPERNGRLARSFNKFSSNEQTSDLRKALAFYTGHGKGTIDCIKQLAQLKCRGEWVPA